MIEISDKPAITVDEALRCCDSTAPIEVVSSNGESFTCTLDMMPEELRILPIRSFAPAQIASQVAGGKYPVLRVLLSDLAG